jgi:hypothetical protein
MSHIPFVPKQRQPHKFNRKGLGLQEHFKTANDQYKEFKRVANQSPHFYRAELSWTKFAPGPVAWNEPERVKRFTKLGAAKPDYSALAKAGQLPSGYAGGGCDPYPETQFNTKKTRSDPERLAKLRVDTYGGQGVAKANEAEQAQLGNSFKSTADGGT